MELHLVPSLELPQLPEIRLDHRHRADKSAQARTIRAEDHRHVASEVHCADRVRIVVDVRRMQAGLTAIGPHPFRFRPDQPYAGSAGVEMHFPLGREEGADVVFSEVFRCPMGAVDHPYLAYGRQLAELIVGQPRTDITITQGWHMQHVAGPQSTAAMPAKLAEGEGTLAAQVIRNLQAAAHAQIAARASTGNRSEAKRGTGWNQHCRVHRHAFAVQRQRNHRARDGNDRVAIEAQQGPAHGDFQRCGAFIVAQQKVTQAQRTTVHRPRWRHAYRPIAEATGIVLDAGLGAGAEHFESVGLIRQGFQATGPGLTAGKRRIEQDLPQVVPVGLHPVEQAFAQGLMQIGCGLLTGRGPTDDLGDHRIEVGWDLATGLDPGVDAQFYAVGRWKVHRSQQTRTRLKVPPWIFRIQPCLNRMTLRFQTLAQCAQRRQVTRCQLHHPAHQVDAPDLLGDAVFHLQAGVHFKEVETLGIAVEHELDGAGAAVIHRLGQFDRRRAQFIGHTLWQVRRRGFFEDFLVAPLHRAVAHAEGNHLATAVTEYLHFQMSGALDVLLDEHPGVAEIVLAQALDRFEGFAQFGRAAAHAHADATTAGGALEHDRITDLRAGDHCRVKAVEQFGTFEHRHAVLFGQGAGGVLEAEYAQLFGRRADKGNVGGLAGLSERSVFREKTIAWMDRGGACGLGDGEDFFHCQVGAGGCAFTKAVGLVGLQDVQARGIGFGIYGNTCNLQFAQGAQDAAGNGATVGNQDFFEHGITPGGDAGRPAVFR